MFSAGQNEAPADSMLDVPAQQVVRPGRAITPQPDTDGWSGACQHCEWTQEVRGDVRESRREETRRVWGWEVLESTRRLGRRLEGDSSKVEGRLCQMGL